MPATHEPSLISLLKHLFNRQVSTFVVIFGRRGSGKTDFAFLIAEVLFTLKIIRHVATNVEFIDPVRIPIDHVTNLDDLQTWCQDHQGKKLFLFDEIGRTVTRRKPMSVLNVDLINEFQILRKYKLSVVAITVDEKYTDNAILGQDVLDGVFKKPSWKNPEIALYDDFLENIHEEFYNLPPTDVKFDTWSSALFTRHGKVKKPKFTDEQQNILWEWSHGATAKALGIDRKQIHRISTKFIKEVLERESGK